MVDLSKLDERKLVQLIGVLARRPQMIGVFIDMAVVDVGGGQAWEAMIVGGEWHDITIRGKVGETTLVDGMRVNAEAVCMACGILDNSELPL